MKIALFRLYISLFFFFEDLIKVLCVYGYNSLTFQVCGKSEGVLADR